MKKTIIVLSLIFSLGGSLFSQCFVLVWEDEFEGSSLDLNNWNHEVNCNGGGNNELQCYTSSTDNVSVADGKLTITAIEEDYLGHDYTSGRINTTGKFSFKYGKVEASLKLPYGQGMWPAFWMLPEDWVYGGWPNSGEIDIMELVGHEPNKVHGTVHTGPPYNYLGNSYTLPSGDFSDDFHVFGVEWEENEIRWYVDGNLYSTLTPSNIGPWAPFQEEFHLLLNVAVGGNWPGSPNASTVFPQTMEAEWVRVYENIDDISIEGSESFVPNQSNTVYSFPNVDGASYSWSVPSGASIVSGQNTNSIVVDWACDPGVISLDLTTSCGVSNFVLNVFDDIEVISGEEQVTPQQTGLEFSIAQISGATSYTWSVPGGAQIVSGQGSNMITVDWGSIGGPVTLEVVSPCGTENYSLDVILGPYYNYCDFDEVDLNFIPFSGSSFSEVSNLDMSGINTSNLVGQSSTGNDPWSGIFADLPNDIDFSESHTFSLKVYGPVTGDLIFKIEDASGVSPETRTASMVQTNEWVEYFFDFNGVPSGVFDRIALFFNFGSSNNSTFYFDDVFLGAPVLSYGCTNPNANNYNSDASSDDGSCQFDVNFSVDMNCENSFTNVYLTGPVLGWCASCVPMTDADMDGVYEVTLDLPEGEFEYKYQLDEWSTQEDLVDDMLDGASCAPITDYSSYANRIVDVGAELGTNDTYGTCGECFIPVYGCYYEAASNYNSEANIDDGSCMFDSFGSDCPGDSNGDGLVNVLDLVGVSSNFGDICD